MKKILLISCCLLLSWNANALEVAGVKLADSVSLGNQALVLNGAGLRTKWFFNIYVSALYLPQKQTSAEAIIADEHIHRIEMYMLHELSAQRLFDAFNDAIEANHTPAELTAMDAQIIAFKKIFDSVKEVKPGDIITLDYLPPGGTRVTVNGTDRGIIAGADFNRALLKIWLGQNPVQDDLKKGMLGG